MSDVPTIFNYIDQIIFSKKNRKDSINNDSAFTGFMLNRWASMHSPIYAEIINATSNKYLTTLQQKDDQFDFLYHVIPKSSRKKINYIKKVKKTEKKTEKKKKEDEIDKVKLFAKNKELSVREITLYNLFE